MKNGATARRRWLARASGLAIAISLGLPVAAFAQDQETSVGELIITATRRAESVQDVPLNIAAIGGAQIAEQGLSDLSEIAAWVPGVYIGDTGSRGSSRIVVRGLNATPAGSAEGINNDGGGTVATYLGEIPIYVDLKLNDMQRVEFLLGPQGTLYGAGTLGGAVRYIPVKPKLGQDGGSVRGNLYSYAHGAALSSDVGATFNKAFGDTLALRGNLDYLNDRGFIDYKYVVRDIGVSDPDAIFNGPGAIAANLIDVPDANTEKALSGRLALRWKPTDNFDTTLTYYYQKTDSGARQISQAGLTNLPVTLGRYESALRVLEPQTQKNQLLSLESTLDLGLAELTSATGYSTYKEGGQRDQTDLLIGLEYSYELFPTFTAFTREDQKDNTFTQELRIVSKSDSKFSWLGGLFYNRQKADATSKEFTPGYDVFNGGSRPDALEYISVDRQKLQEMAAYGEIAYEITPKWRVALGARYFDYDLEVSSAADTPFYNTVFGGAAPDAISLNFSTDTQKDSGFLYKFNSAYDFTDDIMGYFTASQGYRIGGFNGVANCPNPVPIGVPTLCGLPNELFYEPDKTTNFELGLKTRLFDRRLTLNGDIYYIEWDNIQLDTATVNGALPIKKNGEGARSLGLEVNFNALVGEHVEIRGSYAHTEAELTALAPNLVRYIQPPGFSTRLNAVYADGKKGDRLPGSPEDQASLFVSYKDRFDNGWSYELSYGVTYVGEILTRTGGLGGSYTLPAYDLHSLTATLKGDRWTMSAYVDNLFDTYAQSGARTTPLFNQVIPDVNGDPTTSRNFFTYVLPPMSAGLRFTRSFGAE